MSNQPQEPNPEQWPTYPGVPSDASQSQPHPQTPPSSADPYANPAPYASPNHEDEAFRAYQDYAQARPDSSHEQLQPYSDAPYRRPAEPGADWLQNKWTWIVGGILAALVITGMVQSDTWWPLIIFAIVVWRVLKHRRRG